MTWPGRRPTRLVVGFAGHLVEPGPEEAPPLGAGDAEPFGLLQWRARRAMWRELGEALAPDLVEALAYGRGELP